MLRGWISSKKDSLTPSSSAHSLNRLTEIEYLKESLDAADLIFDDNLEGAEAGLAHGQSTFHKLGRGLVQFIRASLGFESDIMQQAAETLADAAASAAKDLKQAQRDPDAFRSQIYEAGTEYMLCIAMAELMSAVIAVFRESIIDGMKGFLKLNSAYKTLQKIIEAEHTHIRSTPFQTSRTVPNTPSKNNFPRDTKTAPSSPLHNRMQNLSIDSVVDQSNAQGNDTNGNDTNNEDDDDEFFDADEDDKDHEQLKNYAGKLEINGVDLNPLTKVRTPPSATAIDVKDLDSPIDEFIHSGATLCYGMLNLMLSLVPSAFARLLSIVGYKGDRRKGLQMLWSSSRLPNAMGALAGLILLAYHNGLIGSMDIVPLADPTADLYSDDNLDGYPAEQLEKLLRDVRSRFPESKLWAIEQARMLAVQRRLDESLDILKGDMETPLKQVQALAIFERSLQAMYSHDYQFCTDSFKECCEKNNWSHPLYLYTAGAAQVELYRITLAKGDKDVADKYAKEAVKLIKEARDKTGKKKAFGRQLPFDTFVIHKVSKWEAREVALKIPFINAIGVSPLEEMTFLWNGFRKMSKPYLETSLESLAWSEKHNPNWEHEENDEKALLYLLTSVVLRSLEKYDEATTMLEEKVLCYEKHQLKGTNKEDWILPAANYEMAANLWLKCYRDPLPQARAIASNYGEGNPVGSGEHGLENKKFMREAAEWLEKVTNWDGFLLDARIGLRVKAGLDTVRRWRKEWDSA